MTDRQMDGHTYIYIYIYPMRKHILYNYCVMGYKKFKIYHTFLNPSQCCVCFLVVELSIFHPQLEHGTTSLGITIISEITLDIRSEHILYLPYCDLTSKGKIIFCLTFYFKRKFFVLLNLWPKVGLTCNFYSKVIFGGFFC